MLNLKKKLSLNNSFSILKIYRDIQLNRFKSLSNISANVSEKTTTSKKFKSSKQNNFTKQKNKFKANSFVAVVCSNTTQNNGKLLVMPCLRKNEGKNLTENIINLKKNENFSTPGKTIDKNIKTQFKKKKKSLK